MDHQVYISREVKNLGHNNSAALIKKAVNVALAAEGIEDPCEINVMLTDDEGIRALNSEYRGIDRATDVLSFPLVEDGNLDDAFDGERLQLGDVVLSVEHARAQAETFGHSFEREVAFLCVHSALHLLGYDHELGEKEDEDMRARQRGIMKLLGLEVQS